MKFRVADLLLFMTLLAVVVAASTQNEILFLACQAGSWAILTSTIVEVVYGYRRWIEILGNVASSALTLGLFYPTIGLPSIAFVMGAALGMLLARSSIESRRGRLSSTTRR